MVHHMAKLQQLLVQMVIGTMAFGGVACLCPALADAAVVSSPAHSHHSQHVTLSTDGTASQVDCGHEDCEAGCERESAVASKVFGGASGKSLSQLDYTSISPPAIPIIAPSPGEVASTSSAGLRIPLPQETPVQRFDRLLD